MKQQIPMQRSVMGRVVNINKIKKFLYFCGLIAAFSHLIYGITYFWIGFHNLDSSQNFRWIEENINKNLRELNIANKYKLADISTDFTTSNFEHNYLMGLEQIRHGLSISIVSAFLSGIFIHVIYSKND